MLYCWLVSSVMGGMDDVRNDREALFLVPCELNVYVGCGLTARSEVDFLRCLSEDVDSTDLELAESLLDPKPSPFVCQGHPGILAYI